MGPSVFDRIPSRNLNELYRETYGSNDFPQKSTALLTDKDRETIEFARTVLRDYPNTPVIGRNYLETIVHLADALGVP